MITDALSRRGQMEIMGLLIIVILLILGVLFAVQFVVEKPVSEAKQEYETSQLTSNFINALLKTSTKDCAGRTINDLYVDCAQFSTLRCDNGQPSCEYLNETIDYIFEETLDKWRRRYEFTARIGPRGTLPITYLNNSCSRTLAGVSSITVETYPLPLNDGRIITLEMLLCN